MPAGKLIKYVGKKKQSQRERRIIRRAVRAMNKGKAIRSLDTSFDGTFNATAAASFCTALVTDSGKSKIIGVRVSGFCSQDLTSTLLDDYRVDLVLDRLPDGVLLTAAKYTQSSDETPLFNELIKDDMTERFKILKSWKGHFNENTVVHREINWYKKLNLVADSNAAGNITQASQTKNALYFVCWTTAAANQPSYVLEARVYYQDI